jgi:MATE family multidrug resistance protein
MNKEILRLAIPNIISNISIPLLSTVDTALMGRLSAAHLGAVGLSSMLFNFIYWNFGFLRMGTTGMTAQAYGAENNKEIAAVLTRGLALAALLALIIFGLKEPIFAISADLLNVNDSQVPLVKEYFDVRIYGAPASFALFCLMGWFFGMQNAVIPLVITIVINVTNMAVSAYLVQVANMEIKGVAIGTVIAQYLGLLLSVIFILLRYRSNVKEISISFLKDIQAIKGYLSINRDLFIRTVCLTFGFGFFYSMSSKAGAMILAVNVILQQFLNWMSYAVDGFAYASESLVGKYKGKKDNALTLKSIRYSFYWGFAFALVFVVVYTFMGVPILKLFTNEIDVIEATKPFLVWVAIIPIFGFASYIWDGVYIGLTASRTMRNAMLLALLCYLFSFYALEGILTPVNNLWISLIIFLGSRGIIQWLYFRKYGLDLP